jgi:hypothetical protein
MCTFITHFPMNDVGAVRRAPCIFRPIGILDVEKCKRICLPPFVTLVLLSNLGTRFCLRRVVLTPKIGKSRLGPGRPVRSGPKGGLTGCPVAGLAQRGQAV